RGQVQQGRNSGHNPKTMLIPMSRLYYILMTKCWKCAKLKPLKAETVKMQPNTEYVLAVSEKDVFHPVTGIKTMKANEPFLLNEGEAVMRYGCPRNPELTFVKTTGFAEQCSMFEEAKKPLN
ncbi:hypothetical protein MUP79_01655, partial [Candidatus Bathyarchaeota archaeon]|nr:hypothetical protein [Candidatus Bathyarchaeota archaeon]